MKGTYWDQEITRFKRALLVRTLELEGGHAKAAKKLGIHKRYLRRLCRDYGIDPPNATQQSATVAD